MENKDTKVITPVELVQKQNPLVKNIGRVSKKWNKRWPYIEQPWPIEGTLNPDVIKTMRVLVSAYKANQKKGRTGHKRKEKRQIELAILQLFESEGQKLAKAANDKKEKIEEEILNNDKITEKLMAEIDAPFSHVNSVKKPPPYMKQAKFEKIYPLLPVISQEGDYQIKNEEEQIVERGQAKTTIEMYPSVKTKNKLRLETQGKLKFNRRKSGDDGSKSDEERHMGGYEPAIRRVLARAERRGGKLWRKKDSGDISSSESEYASSDDVSGSEKSSTPHESFPAASSTRLDEDRQHTLRKVERNIDLCHSLLEGNVDPERRGPILDELEHLILQRKDLQEEAPQKSERRYTLRSRKGTVQKKMLPAVVRGQTLEYKPWQSTDMSDILEKLPVLQDGAHPWISKLEEIMVGTQAAIGDIKRLLANLLGVPAMEEILQKAGLNRYVGTAVNDPELFAANRARMWRALRETFPTNVHPDNILIEPLREEENPRAYVSRVHQVWRNVTGHDPDLNQMEQSILRAKLEKGLPLSVRSRLAEVVGLGSMAKGVYTDHIAHQVELFRKK